MIEISIYAFHAVSNSLWLSINYQNFSDVLGMVRYCILPVHYSTVQTFSHSRNCYGQTVILFGHFLPPYIESFPFFLYILQHPLARITCNPKMAFIFPISCILALIFPIVVKIFPTVQGKGRSRFPKSQIKSLAEIVKGRNVQ